MKSYEVGKITEFEQHNLHFVEGKLNVGEEQAVPVIKETINFVMNKFFTGYSSDFLMHLRGLLVLSSKQQRMLIILSLSLNRLPLDCMI